MRYVEKLFLTSAAVMILVVSAVVWVAFDLIDFNSKSDREVMEYRSLFYLSEIFLNQIAAKELDIQNPKLSFGLHAGEGATGRETVRLAELRLSLRRIASLERTTTGEQLVNELSKVVDSRFESSLRLSSDISVQADSKDVYKLSVDSAIQKARAYVQYREEALSRRVEQAVLSSQSAYNATWLWLILLLAVGSALLWIQYWKLSSKLHAVELSLAMFHAPEGSLGSCFNRETREDDFLDSVKSHIDAIASARQASHELMLEAISFAEAGVVRYKALCEKFECIQEKTHRAGFCLLKLGEELVIQNKEVKEAYIAGALWKRGNRDAMDSLSFSLSKLSLILPSNSRALEASVSGEKVLQGIEGLARELQVELKTLVPFPLATSNVLTELEQLAARGRELSHDVGANLFYVSAATENALKIANECKVGFNHASGFENRLEAHLSKVSQSISSGQTHLADSIEAIELGAAVVRQDYAGNEVYSRELLELVRRVKVHVGSAVSVSENLT